MTPQSVPPPGVTPLVLTPQDTKNAPLVLRTTSLTGREAWAIYERVILRGQAPVFVTNPFDESLEEKLRGKPPVYAGWNKTDYASSMDVGEHAYPPGTERGYNVATRCGHVPGAPCPVIFLDADSAEALAWLREHVPHTPMRTIPSRFEQWGFRMDKRARRVKSLNLRARMGLDLDVQADDRIVVTPGSVHRTGVVYREAEPWPESVEDFERLVPLFEPDWFPKEVRDAIVGEPLQTRVVVPGNYSGGSQRGHDPGTGGAEENNPGEPDVPIERRVARGKRYLNEVAKAEMRHRQANQGRPDPNRVSVSGMDGQRALMSVAYFLVWGLSLPPAVAAETILNSAWNDLCCDKDGNDCPWEMEGNQGLLRKCSEVLTDDMVGGKERPRGYLLAERPEQGTGETGAGNAEGDTAAAGGGAADSGEPGEKQRGSARFKSVDQPERVDKPWAEDWELNDLGNAERFEARYGGRAIYVPGLDWHCWLGRRWAPSPLTAARWAQETARLIREESAHWDAEAEEARVKFEANGDPELERAAKAKGAQAKAVRDWHRQSGNVARTRGMLEQAQSRLIVPHAELDQDPYLLNCRNGCLDLRTGEFSPPDPAKYLTRMASVDYAPEARCPYWEERMTEWLPEQELRDYIQEWAGVTLTGDPKLQACLILLGKGGNGKGVLMNTLARLLGDYAVVLDADVLVGGEGSGISANAAQEQKLRLRGARMVRVSEAPDEGKMSSKTLKSLVSSDTVIGRRLRDNNVEFDISHKIWLALNHKPVVSDTTDSIWRRLKIVHFSQKFSEDRRRPEAEIDMEISIERPGILNWALDGLQRVLARTGGRHLELADPPMVKAEVRQYREQMDVVGEWLGECCEVDSTKADLPEFKCKAKDLYEEFYVWCSLQHIKFIRGRNTFYEDMSAKGVSQRKVSNLLYFCGIRLTSRQTRGDLRGRAGANGAAAGPGGAAGPAGQMVQ